MNNIFDDLVKIINDHKKYYNMVLDFSEDTSDDAKIERYKKIADKEIQLMEKVLFYLLEEK